MLTTKEGRRPLHEKVREHLRVEYLGGSSEALPSLRDLSQKLQINHATISRALRDLEQEGVVRVVPRKGIFPTGQAGAPVKAPVQPTVSAPQTAAFNVEMVVLYDDIHGQLDVARPVFSGMEQACEEMRRGAATDLPMTVTRSMVPISPVPDVCEFVKSAKERGIQGVVFLGFGYLPFPASLVESRFIFEVSQHLPVVLAGTPHSQLRLDCSYCDPRPQMREFLEAAYAKGLRHFEFIGSGLSQPHQLERHEEFCNFVMRHGIAWKQEFLDDGTTDQLAARLRALPQLPEVVVATNMSRAIVVALEAQRRGLKLPDDLQLLGFASLAEHAQPLLPYASVLLLDEPGVGAQAWNDLYEKWRNPSTNAAAGAEIVRRVPARFISNHGICPVDAGV